MNEIEDLHSIFSEEHDEQVYRLLIDRLFEKICKERDKDFSIKSIKEDLYIDLESNIKKGTGHLVVIEKYFKYRWRSPLIELFYNIFKVYKALILSSIDIEKIFKTAFQKIEDLFSQIREKGFNISSFCLKGFYKEIFNKNFLNNKDILVR